MISSIIIPFIIGVKTSKCRLDELHLQREQQANLLKQSIREPIYAKSEYELRWSRFKDIDPELMFHFDSDFW